MNMNNKEIAVSMKLTHELHDMIEKVMDEFDKMGYVETNQMSEYSYPTPDEMAWAAANNLREAVYSELEKLGLSTEEHLEVNGFETIPQQECWEIDGWGVGIKKGSDVLRGYLLVYIGQMDDGRYVCEMLDNDNATISTWFGETPAKAFSGAVENLM